MKLFLMTLLKPDYLSCVNTSRGSDFNHFLLFFFFDYLIFKDPFCKDAIQIFIPNLVVTGLIQNNAFPTCFFFNNSNIESLEEKQYLFSSASLAITGGYSTQF